MVNILMISSVGKPVEDLHSTLLSAGMNNGTSFQEHFANLCQNFNHNDPATQGLSIYPKGLKIGTQILVHRCSRQYHGQ